MRSIAFVLLTGCTGMTLGEHLPGGDTPVDPGASQPGEHRMGAIAVQPDQAQLWVVHEENRNGVLAAHLAAIDPDTGGSSEVLDVSNTGDRRVMFPSADRMILMAQANGHDNLVLIDTAQRKKLAEVTSPTWYWGTRTAPSGRAVVVADNADPKLPLHVIDTATLQHQVIAHGGDEIEAMWNHHADVLLALSVTDPFSDHPVASLLRYDWRGADFTQPLPGPTVAWSLAGYGWDFLFSFTWIGISPDDHWAVFPLIKHTVGPDDGEHVLLVLDQTTGKVSLVPGMGPVGFTRDSSKIVSYGLRPGAPAEDLWLIDPATHATQVVTMPWSGGGISFYPLRDADYIVATGGGDLAVYDQQANAVRSIPAASVDLADFVTRPGKNELWLESGGEVSALTLATPKLAPITVGEPISTINIRPAADQAVVGNGDTAHVYRLDMASHAIVGPAIRLPSPFDVVAADRLVWTAGRSEPVLVHSAFDPQYRTRELPTVPRARSDMR